MAEDKREQILVYLQTLLGQVEGIVSVHRDRGGLEADEVPQLPAAIVLDATEEIRTNIRGQSLVSMPVAVFTLEPQIWIQLRPRDSKTNLTLNQQPAPVGPELSLYRARVLKKLLSDVNLAAMLGNNGQVEYRGCDTDMQTGSMLIGQILLRFAFSYVLDTAQL